MSKRTKRKAYKSIFRNIGNAILIISTIVIPTFICIWETQINNGNYTFLREYIERHSNEVTTDFYATFTGIEILNSGIAVVGIAVSVWIGLNIYNNCKEKHFEQHIKALEIETKQLKKEYQKRVFLSYLERTRDMYELSEFFYDAFKIEEDEVDECEYELLSAIEMEFVSCCQYYEKGYKNVAAEYAKSGNDIIAGNRIKNYLADESLVNFYMVLRRADFIFYESMQADTIGKEALQESIDEYKRAYEKLEEMKSKISRDKYNRLEIYMLNSIGYTYIRLFDVCREDSQRENWIDHAFKYLEKIEDMKPKGRYLQNLGACYEKSNLEGKYETALDYYLKAYNARNRDPKIYNLLGSVYLKLVDEKLGINTRTELLSELKITDMECIKYIEMALMFLETALHVTPELIDVYYNYAKASFYYSIWVLEEKKENPKTESLLRFAEERNPQNAGVLFTYRNYYETIGKIEKAREYNLKLNQKGDAKRIETLYEKFK